MDNPYALAAPARKYLAAGLCVLPANARKKYPDGVLWTSFQDALPTPNVVDAWFRNPHDALCLVTGAVSGHLELLDFDCRGQAYAPWRERVEAAMPGLLDRLYLETSPSGGWHVVYRGELPVSRSLKLAQRMDAVAPEEIIQGDAGKPMVERYCKLYQPTKDQSGNWRVLLTLIETRGEGGLFLCAPSIGYTRVQGDLCCLSVLTESEREVLLSAAWELNEYVPPAVNGPAAPSSAKCNGSGTRPGDDFNARGDVRELLLRHGWTMSRAGENEHWCRPGKTGSTSATLKDNVLYVFSTSTAFEANRAYSPFAVYTILEHGGNYEAAARALRDAGFGSDVAPGMAEGVDISRIVSPGEGNAPREPEVPDPGPFPVEMLRIPGFISEVMDYTMETAPYPNQVLAFCGALSLQAFLGGRKVRDPGDSRTNLYLLGLAHSAAGKDWPRKVNTRILYSLGLADCLGDRFASGEGIQDALFMQPSMLFQTDEIDGMLQQINKSPDARHENVMGTLMTMYSSANSVFPMRRKAGREAAGAIDQPCLNVFGTAIPKHYYEALSPRMLNNGFFSRMIILESGPRSEGQEPTIREIPDRVQQAAKWWADFCPGTGNLQNFHPVPAIVEQTPEALDLLIATRKGADAEYAKSQSAADEVGTAVWGRVNEQARRFALLYAISENHQQPVITRQAAEWASAFIMHQTQRMLFMAYSHVAENPFHAGCLRLLEKLREAPDGCLAHSILLKRMKMDARSFAEMVTTLEQQGDIKTVIVPRAGTPMRNYQLMG